ncbi:hypothetical protein BN1723_001808 [Verticillium longisporum]|uniref:Cytochrome b5 heme-binding domain-containing protein n=1 Tax=Verticillium longisporum TaxID=100787 RepID=A0A0G4KP70_VERLO|nr:hypothetical protein BN1723_001808 [Verticillium longisporum]
MYGEKGKNGYFGANDGSDSRSEAGVSAFGGGDMFKNFDTREQMAERGNEKSLVEVEEYRDSASRKRWLFMVYLLTWFIPDFLIRFIGRMPRKDVRMAWREKLAINLIIWLSCLLAAFFIVVFPMLICPRQHVYSAAELSSYDGTSGSPGAYVSIRGYVFDLEKFAPRHYPPNLVSTEDILEYAGKDATSLFPVQVSALCQGRAGSIDPAVLIDYRSTNMTGSPTLISQQDVNANFHDFRYFTNDTRKDWYFQQMAMLRANYLKGRIGYSPKYMKTLAGKSRTIVSMNGRVFDLTEYIIGGRRTIGEDGKSVSGVAEDSVNFMEEDVITLFKQLSGADATRHWASLNLSQQAKTRMLTCLNNLYYVGDVDTRSSVRCKFAEYLVLAISIMLVTIIAFKFFAALQFGTKNMPENLDKFIMCQIPAYTEDEDSLRLLQPVTMAYIVYLIVMVIRSPDVVPITAFILIAAVFGLQAIIFILRRKWEMIGWMVLYILAIPVFSFGLPLYSFWYMDDFNWGNTRVVAGEKGKKIIVTDEGKFDPASIPRKKWEEYQGEIWEAQTVRDDARSEVSGYSYATKGHPGVQVGISEYGGYSRPGSIAGGFSGAHAMPPLPMNTSRMSLAASEMGGNRASQFGGSHLCL